MTFLIKETTVKSATSKSRTQNAKSRKTKRGERPRADSDITISGGSLFVEVGADTSGTLSNSRKTIEVSAVSSNKVTRITVDGVDHDTTAHPNNWELNFSHGGVKATPHTGGTKVKISTNAGVFIPVNGNPRKWEHENKAHHINLKIDGEDKKVPPAPFEVKIHRQ